jgi:hypothetical protein
VATYAGGEAGERSFRDRLRTRKQREEIEAAERAAQLQARMRLWDEVRGRLDPLTPPDDFRRDLIPSGLTAKEAERLRAWVAGSRASREASMRDGVTSDGVTVTSKALTGGRTR